MIHVLAGCFPNCTPGPSSGFSAGPGGSSSAALGGAVVILVIWLLIRMGSKGGSK